MNNQRMNLKNNQEQYSRTLFFRNTSNRFFVAIVSGIHPGILMSKFF